MGVTDAAATTALWRFAAHEAEPGARRGAQVVRASCPFAKAAGLTPGQGGHKQQPASACVRGTTPRCLSLKSVHQYGSSA